MKIESYNVEMQANSSFAYKEQTKVESSLKIGSAINLGQLNFSENLNIKQSNSVKVVFNEEDSLSPIDRVKKLLIEYLLNRHYKHNGKIKLYPNELNHHSSPNRQVPYNQSVLNPSWGFTYENTQEYYQKSSIEFSTQATIKTNNGEFNINLNLSYTQEFYEMHQTRLSMGNALFEDPLIINYNTDIGTFDNIDTNMSFEFDLNSDGENELIPQLKDGSGFLALDKNHNGSIDNGNELFGPTSGDGFEELRAYDEDGNNWIDENDSIYSDLLIWEKDSEGNSSLITLGQAGVGAIYLAGVNTNFTYANSIEDQTAKLKETSFFLKENGEAGIVTSVDFAV